MKHLAAYLLLGLAGKTSPSAADIKTVLESVGIEADSDRLDKLISELEGKSVDEVRFGVNAPARAGQRVDEEELDPRC
jgi:large subunit ribosomal protein LP2